MKAPDKPLRTAVLLIAFNRVDTARQVFAAIRKARPSRLYFACDGARNAEEQVRCNEVRALAKEVDWDCEVKTRFLEHNAGIMHGVSGAIGWFFEHEAEGIILEDDTLPVPSFFGYCEELLERYRHDRRIWMIQGNNLMCEWSGEGSESYYFSTHGYGAPWGWAGWRRVWEKYDVGMSEWTTMKDSPLFNAHFLNGTEKREAHFLFHHTHTGEIKSWSYQMDFKRIMDRGVNIIPNRNLIRNIGFGSQGTNTLVSSDPRDKQDQSDIDLPLVHPGHCMVDEARDLAYFNKYIKVWATPGKRFRAIFKRVLPEPMVHGISSWALRMRKDS